MGTDINCWVELRNGSRWVQVSEATDESGRIRSLNIFAGVERDGAVFAILAGLGAESYGVTPIQPNRGFPADSPYAPDAGFRETATCHDATWLTLSEIVNFPWEETRSHEICYVDADSFLRLQIEGRPGKIKFDIGASRLVRPDEMKQLLDSGRRTRGLVTQIDYGSSYAELAGPFFTQGIPLLKQVGPVDDVRLIVWFDS